MNKNLRIYLTVVVCAIIGLATLFLRKPAHRFMAVSGVVWTTEYNITFQGPASIADSIEGVFNAVDRTASMFNPKSVISRINANDPTVEPNAMITELYKCSARINSESGGCFDPTVAPLVNAWGFGFKRGVVTDSATIDSIRQFVGFDKTHISADGRIEKTDPRVVIDFSSIAKGFACDELARLFMRNGVENFIIEIGGEIFAHGCNRQGKPWHISIDSPIDQADSVIHQSAMVISLSNHGVATSGNYRNYKIVDGKRVSHIINPATGYPEQSSLLSATIVAPTAAEADAYATACMVMGTERSRAMIERNDAISGILIYADSLNRINKWVSKEFDNKE